MDQVGQDFSDGSIAWGADAVEPGSVRRFIEPLEFDCKLHYDAEVATQYGYAGIVAPYSSFLTFTFPAVWSPGETQFAHPQHHAQPARLSVQPKAPPGTPQVTGFFVVDWNADFHRSVTVGERLGRRGERLLSCVPKETKVGQGAFLTLESDIVSSVGDVVATFRRTVYLYNPKPRGSQ